MTISATILTAVVSLFLAVPPTQNPVQILAQENYSLTNRYKVASVNTVFDENILLTLSYLSGQTKVGQKVDWSQVNADSEFQFILPPGKTFAFHDQVMPEYTSSVVLTTGAHFSSDQGFKSDGYLVGDGVCQLASFLNVVANEAGLTVNAPTNHDFAVIPNVDKKYGTAIYYDPDAAQTSQRENLYITNPLDKPVAFHLAHHGDNLAFSVTQVE